MLLMGCMLRNDTRAEHDLALRASNGKGRQCRCVCPLLCTNDDGGVVSRRQRRPSCHLGQGMMGTPAVDTNAPPAGHPTKTRHDVWTMP
jgi:hypothetical protein